MESRKLAVLKAIVDGYVADGEPIGSKAITTRHSFNVSAATIRNDMAALEAAGLITQPHTSAGRVPTDGGYRVYVDKLAVEKPLPLKQQLVISNYLDVSAGFEDTLARASRLVAELTGQVAIVQVPQSSPSKIQRIELVSLGSESTARSKILFVIIFDSGRVIQQQVALGIDSVDELDNLSLFLNQVAQGVQKSQLEHAFSIAVSGLPIALQEEYRLASTAVLATLDMSPEAKLVISGTANATRTETHFGNDIHTMLEALESQVAVLTLLTQIQSETFPTNGNEMGNSLRVRIGHENRTSGFNRSSIVAANYGSNKTSGTAVVGTIGPTRIDYPKTMATVRAVANYLSRD
jgi:heat-inducible transcriptional repressor